MLEQKVITSPKTNTAVNAIKEELILIHFIASNYQLT